ncbi:MAG: helix-turn-helix domain-containing protein [Pseudomonadota bacterium]|jgi:transcriptional regulator with XRE-family HTH domain
MLFGERLTLVRKKRKTSQDELAKAIGVHAPVIGRYERDEVKPSIEVAAKIAQSLGVSLDYLTGNSDLELDADVIKKIQEIQKLPEKDRDHLFYVVDNILQNVKAKKAFAA